MLVVCLVSTIAVTYVYIEDSQAKLTSVLGFVASCIAVIFFASPLQNLVSKLRLWSKLLKIPFNFLVNISGLCY